LCARLSSTNTIHLYWHPSGYQLQKRLYSAPSWTDVPDVPVLVGDRYLVSLDELSGWVTKTCHSVYMTNNCITNITYDVGPCTSLWFVTNNVHCATNVVAYCVNNLFIATGFGWYWYNDTNSEVFPSNCGVSWGPTNEQTLFRLRRQ